MTVLHMWRNRELNSFFVWTELNLLEKNSTYLNVAIKQTPLFGLRKRAEHATLHQNKYVEQKLRAGSGRNWFRLDPDDGQRNCPKNVELYYKNKFQKLVHPIGFIIRI